MGIPSARYSGRVQSDRGVRSEYDLRAIYHGPKNAMTWVIGASTMFGYGIVISDTRVTCQTSGRTKDILQKAFPVGKWIVAGLAGDVSIGLTLLRSLQLFLLDLNLGANECGDPEQVAEQWSKEAKRIYADASEEDDIGPCHILTVGLQPTADVFGGAKVCVSVYRSPDFIPETIIAGNRALSIGSGTDVSRYRESLERMLSDEHLVYMQGEMWSIGGFGKIIWQALRREVSANPVQSVSPHFHLFLIRLGGIEEWHSPGMPEVAHNWPELLQKIGNEMESDALVARTDIVRQPASLRTGPAPLSPHATMPEAFSS